MENEPANRPPATHQPSGRSDPLIDEVRAVRKAISDANGNDVSRLGEALRQVQRQYADRVSRKHTPPPDGKVA